MLCVQARCVCACLFVCLYVYVCGCVENVLDVVGLRPFPESQAQWLITFLSFVSALDPWQQHRGVRPWDVLQRRLGAVGRDQAARAQARRRRHRRHRRKQERIPRCKFFCRVLSDMLITWAVFSRKMWVQFQGLASWKLEGGKARQQVGTKPTTSWLSGVCFTAVLKPMAPIFVPFAFRRVVPKISQSKWFLTQSDRGFFKMGQPQPLFRFFPSFSCRKLNSQRDSNLDHWSVSKNADH